MIGARRQFMSERRNARARDSPSSPSPVRKWHVIGGFGKDGPDGRKNLPKFDPAAAPDLTSKYPTGDKDKTIGWREVSTNDPVVRSDC